MHAYIYARKSRFTGKGDSIHDQIDLCIEKAKALGIESYEVFYDEGYCDANTDRPYFQKLLEGIRKKECTHLICYKIDNISYSIKDFVEFIGELDDLGINFVSQSDQLDLSTPIGRLPLDILIGFAELEYTMIQGII